MLMGLSASAKRLWIMLVGFAFVLNVGMLNILVWVHRKPFATRLLLLGFLLSGVWALCAFLRTMIKAEELGVARPWNLLFVSRSLAENEMAIKTRAQHAFVAWLALAMVFIALGVFLLAQDE